MKKILIFVVGCIALLLISFFYDSHPNEVVVAVIDSGIDPENKLFEGKIMKGIDLVEHDFTPNDEEGHGTAMASIIVEQEPNIKILPIRTLNEKGKGNGKGFFGILYALSRDADIVNMSYKEKYNSFTQVLIKIGQWKGTVFVSSTGNEGDEKINYPAKYEGVISVASIDKKNQKIAAFSNYIDEVDFVAPGHYKLTEEEKERRGTSISSAYLSGVIAYLLVQEKVEGKDEVLRYLTEENYHKIITLEKVKAMIEGTSYFWFRYPDFKTTNAFVEVPIDIVNIKKLRLYVNEQEQEATLTKQGSLKVPLKKGYNKIRLAADDERSVFSVLYDSDVPFIKETKLDNRNGLLWIVVEEEVMRGLYVNGEPATCANCREDRGTGKKDYIYIKSTNLDEPMEITAIDLSNRKSTLTVEK